MASTVRTNVLGIGMDDSSIQADLEVLEAAIDDFENWKVTTNDKVCNKNLAGLTWQGNSLPDNIPVDDGPFMGRPEKEAKAACWQRW